jgi:DNA uptake protein ComE-like DNA-binding protein
MRLAAVWTCLFLGLASPAVQAQPAPVDINRASMGELTAVPYIGRKRAEAIMKGRPWQNVDELAVKYVVPRKYLDKIRDRLAAP